MHGANVLLQRRIRVAAQAAARGQRAAEAACHAACAAPAVKAAEVVGYPRLKSLLLRLIAGLIPAHSGQVRWGGSLHLPSGALGFVFQRPVLLRRSVRANLLHALALARVNGPQRLAQCDSLLQLGGMVALADSPARSLSGGEQQMVAIARAMMAKPKLLLLDEPSMGLAPLMVETIFEVIQNLNQQGMTILLVEQNARLALSMADRAYVMESGAITLSGSANQLFNDDRVREAYLGTDLKTKDTKETKET